MFDHLDIYDPRERMAVGIADAALAVAALPLRVLRKSAGPPARVLLLRLERIGDLLMSLGAIRAVRGLAPAARIDLVVGSWNEPIARLIPGIDSVETLDLPWLARGTGSAAWSDLAARALSWRERRYDLAINFEGDVRSHLLMAGSLAPRRVGFDQAGGGSLLTDRVRHDARRHTSANALALVERAFGLSPGTLPDPLSAAGSVDWRLPLPPELDAAGRAVLASAGAAPADGVPVVAMHVSGGRAVKQWPPARFAEVAAALASRHGARVVITGTHDDRALVDDVLRETAGAPGIVDLSGRLDLLVLASVLRHVHLLVTGDTGPMHLAAAVGTPVVAVFGPSDPARYAPLVAERRVVRIDLPCGPCNRIRKPPARCTGVTPDCLGGISTRAVIEAAEALLASRRTAVVPRR